MTGLDVPPNGTDSFLKGRQCRHSTIIKLMQAAGGSADGLGVNTEWS
jgi:hypothetical protein